SAIRESLLRGADCVVSKDGILTARAKILLRQDGPRLSGGGSQSALKIPGKLRVRYRSEPHDAAECHCGRCRLPASNGNNFSDVIFFRCSAPPFISEYQRSKM